jgi:uncharacterized protein YkwD
MESRTFPGSRIEAHAMNKWFVRTLGALALIAAPCAGENASPAADYTLVANNNIPRAQPSPKLIAAANANEDTAAEAALLDLVNRSRLETGAAPVLPDESLRDAAVLHAQRMVSSRQLEHQFPGEPSLLQRIADVSTLPLDRAGENIANVTCVADAHELLMQSPPHRQNLLDPRFNVVGIAALWSHGRLYVVQDFAHAVPSYSAGETATMVGNAIDQVRLNAGLRGLSRFTLPHLNEAACNLAEEGHPNARVIAASYTDQQTITYTQSRPEVLPASAQRFLSDPTVHEFAVGSCYARNANYPTGIYWIAILLY